MSAKNNWPIKKLRKVYLIGLNHSVQWNRALKETSEFVCFLENQIQRLDASLIAEEFLEEALQINNVKATTVQDLAQKYKKNHIFCDPNTKQRIRRGYLTQKQLQNKFGVKSAIEGTEENKRRRAYERNLLFPVREKFWLKKIKQFSDSNILFVCGSEHLESFKALLLKNNYSVDFCWPTKKLKDVCSINGGDPAPQDYTVFSGDGIPFVRMQDLGRYHVTDNLTETRDKIKLEAIKKLSVKIFSKGSIILPRSGSVFANHRAILGIDAVVVSHIAILNNYKDIQPRYLFWYLTKLDIGRHAVKTSNVDSISFQRLGKFEIPVPPLQIQKKIVERLDEIAEAQKLNDGLIKKSDELFQSLLRKELNTTGKDWDIKKLGSVFDRITDAILPTRHPEQKFNFIGLENIESNTSRLINISPVEGRFIKSTKTRFKIGDVLYGKLRPYLNKVWLADFDGICSTDIWALRAKEGIILPQLLGAILQQSSIVQKSSASMAGANLPRANKDIFDKIAVALPPINTQKQIVSKLSAVQDYKKQLLEQKAKLKELFDSVLSKSMNGQL